MKSIEMLIHMVVGMGKGCNAPRGFIVSPLCIGNFTFDHKGVDVLLLHAFPKE
jgi:hypothetical protein